MRILRTRIITVRSDALAVPGIPAGDGGSDTMICISARSCGRSRAIFWHWTARSHSGVKSVLTRMGTGSGIEPADGSLSKAGSSTVADPNRFPAGSSRVG